jgi:predicted AAA+ superfamily ATPase
MERYLQHQIMTDMKIKLILLSGPRQVGKTTLSRSLGQNFQYMNWDAQEDRELILKKSWDRTKPYLIFDELHKMQKFKSFLKGVYDKEGVRPPIIVTGSARLDTIKKLGDSLAGRFFPFRLYPLDHWELRGTDTPEHIYDRLCHCSGFPEPYFKGEESFYSRWSKTHLDLILRQDLVDLESVRNIQSIETLVTLLQERVGSTVSSASLSRDLQKDPKTIRSWLGLLESLFIIFKVPPYHKNISRSLVKEPKYYFYDVSKVRGDEGIVFENIVAISLKKQLDYLGDVHGNFAQLYYLRTRDKKELDFFISFEKKHMIPIAIEAKLSDEHVSPNFSFFRSMIGSIKCIQLVKNLKEKKTGFHGEELHPALSWLTTMNLY